MCISHVQGTHVTFIDYVEGDSPNPIWRKTLSFNHLALFSLMDYFHHNYYHFLEELGEWILILLQSLSTLPTCEWGVVGVSKCKMGFRLWSICRRILQDQDTKLH